MLQSLPAWGAWIEIFRSFTALVSLDCRSPHGRAWVGMTTRCILSTRSGCRSPHGKRGLESERHADVVVAIAVAPRIGSVGWNAGAVARYCAKTQSLPAWGVWIGIRIWSLVKTILFVAPRMGSVGWNKCLRQIINWAICRSRMGSVGWNTPGSKLLPKKYGSLPRTGSAGWNLEVAQDLQDNYVAPRMGSVSWNSSLMAT